MNNTSNNLSTWFTSNPAERDWLLQNKSTNDFAGSLFSSLSEWGSLTEKQMAAIQRNIAQQNIKPVEVNSSRLEAFFTHARSTGLKWPKITLHNIRITMAGENSRNPGSLYVKRGDEYIGKVSSGNFYKVPQCSSEEAEKIAHLLSDPETAMKQYGIETGSCCMCNRELTNPESVAAGIGPICGERFGFGASL